MASSQPHHTLADVAGSVVGMEDVLVAGIEAASLEPPPPGVLIEEHEGQASKWKSILPLLDTASEEMKLGDLLAGECFDLQDAMSAIEIMDPQMDAGMQKEPAVDEPAVPPAPPPADMPASMLIGILDEMTCAEHGHYTGLTLPQTIFRIEWMQNARDVPYLPLRAALIASARAVVATRTIVLRGDIHEEEDYAGSLSGLMLYDDVREVGRHGSLRPSPSGWTWPSRTLHAAHTARCTRTSALSTRHSRQLGTPHPNHVRGASRERKYHPRLHPRPRPRPHLSPLTSHLSPHTSHLSPSPSPSPSPFTPHPYPSPFTLTLSLHLHPYP